MFALGHWSRDNLHPAPFVREDVSLNNSGIDPAALLLFCWLVVAEHQSRCCMFSATSDTVLNGVRELGDAPC